MTDKDEEMSIDFSKVTKFFNKRKRKKEKIEEDKENEEEISLDFNKVKELSKKYAAYAPPPKTNSIKTTIATILKLLLFLCVCSLSGFCSSMFSSKSI